MVLFFEIGKELERRERIGEMTEWLKVHAWKACVSQKDTEGSNPSLSAKNLISGKDAEEKMNNITDLISNKHFTN